MRKAVSVIVLAVLLVSLAASLAGCAKEFDGQYAALQKAAYGLRSYKREDKEPVVSFEESCSDAGGRPALVLRFDNVNDVEKVCGAVKEKFSGLDIPWLVVSDFEDLALEALKDNAFSSLGIVVTARLSGKTSVFDYAPPLAEIEHLERLDPSRLQHNLDEYDSLPGVKELSLSAAVDGLPLSGDALSWIAKCPSLEKLDLRDLTDPSRLPPVPSLAEIETEDSPDGEAAACALFRENPRIKTVNGVDADKYVFASGLSGDDLAKYNAALQRYEIAKIDTSDFEEIAFEDAALSGRVAVAGYGTAESISGFADVSAYLPAQYAAALTPSPEERDCAIVITDSSETIGYYTGGGKATGLSVYARVIDLNARTVTKSKLIYSSSGDAVIVNGNGSTSGRFFAPAVWEKIAALFEEAYK